MVRQYLSLFLVVCQLVAVAQARHRAGKFADSLNSGLQSDIFLHPLNSSTAYTLKKGEIIYAQSPNNLPLPSWAFVGITDRLTAEIDLLPLIGGLFVAPHLPVPSYNFRYKLSEQHGIRPALAFETMFQYLYKEQDQADNIYFATWRKGSSWYNRVNASWKLNKRFHIHFSCGATYSQHLKLVNKDSIHYQEKSFDGKITPDVALGFDYRLKRISFHLHGSYGSTFTYLDNVPRKLEWMYGIRLAPFYKNRFVFIRSFRLEWSGFYMSFPDVKAKAYVPIFLPYLYWQWTIKKKKSEGNTK